MSSLAKLVKFAGLPGSAKRDLDLKTDYRVVFQESEAGRRVLADLMAQCGTDHRQNPFVAGAADMTGYNLGKQSIGRYVIGLLHLPDDEIVRLHTQNRHRKEDTDYGQQSYES